VRTETIGTATLYLGDCREVLPTLPRVNAVVTDPPYGLAKRLAGGTWGAKFSGGLEWDRETALELGEIIKHGDNAIVWGGNYYVLPPSRCWLVWQKPDAVRTMADAELAWTSLDANTRFISHSIAATNAERVNHPTQKPVRVMEWSLSFLPEAKTVLDPFMGSGTTGVACVNQGRAFTGIEVNPDYFEIACNRIRAAESQGRLFA
jgi:site-specific DNA-methyltransferase (adenine-specific)